MTAWLARAGRFRVERLDRGIRVPGQPVTMTAPPKGILHTTEGSWESALTVFRSRVAAPTFMVGRDSSRKVRIVQFVPLGMMGGALENHPGGVETNRICRVQIEIVGNSQHSLWLPEKPVASALAALMFTLREAARIPYRHVVADRTVRQWVKASGWLGHEDVPENVHWDPGNLNWPKLLTLAGQPEEDPYWLWLRWDQGHKEFKKFGPHNMKHRPAVLPKRIPNKWWDRRELFLADRKHVA